MEYRCDSIDELIVATDRPLTDFDRKLFSDLFAPILSPLAVSLYNALNDLIPYGMQESTKTNHAKLLKSLKLKEMDKFIDARMELEALGLLDTYVKMVNDEHNLFFMVIKELPTAATFFQNAVLSSILENEIGSASLNELAAKYLIHQYDINKFERITKNIDEVYTIVNAKAVEASTWWMDTKFSNVTLKDEQFDFELFKILLESKEALPLEILNSKDFYDNVNRMAWVFKIKAEDLAELVRVSITNGELNYDLLRTNCKNFLTKLDIKYVTKKQNQVPTSYNETIKKFVCSPDDLVRKTFGTGLTPTEKEMFDKILVETKIDPIVLNILIFYVLSTKNGEIPTKNYFMKILNTWIRKGISRPEDAFNYAFNPEPTQSKQNSKDPEWFNDYKKQVESKEVKNEEMSLEELEAFFNKNK